MEKTPLRQAFIVLVVAIMVVSCGRKAPPTLDEYSKETKSYCKVYRNVGEDKAYSQQ
jgi:hypothetical protein